MKIKKMLVFFLIFTIFFSCIANGGVFDYGEKQSFTETKESTVYRPAVFHKMLLILPFTGFLYDLYDNFYQVERLLSKDSGINSRYSQKQDFDRDQAVISSLSENRKKQLEGYEQLAFFGFLNESDLGMVFICSLNKVTGEANLLSLPPNFLVFDRAGREIALEEIYGQEGVTETVWALNKALELNLSDVIVFGELAIINGINSAGGAELTLDEEEFKYLNGFITETVERTQIPSRQVNDLTPRMDGVQFAAYLRLLYAARAQIQAQDEHLWEPFYIISEDPAETVNKVSAGMEKAVNAVLEAMKNANLFTYMDIVRTVLPQMNCSFGDGSAKSFMDKFGGFYLGKIKICSDSETAEGINQFLFGTSQDSEG